MSYRWACGIPCAVLSGFVAFGAPPNNESESDYRPKTVIRQPFRPIVDPPIVSANEVSLAANELVIGVEVNGEARAYPINQLTGPRREIINDQLGGTAIAATW